jgi:N-acetylmuramoyl-L-alanine amidase
VAQKENAVIFYEDEYEKNYDGFDPNDPESVISLLLMQETYLEQSIEAANSIQRRFVTNLNRKDRTVKQAGFIVLKYTYMPSVLVETGFLTNPNEGAYLNSTKGQTQMASTIAKAIKNYINEVKANVESSVKILTESNKKPQKQDLIFKIQIAASKKKLDIQPYNFKGLNAITRDETDGLYRYYYETSTNYEGAQQFLKEAQNKGYKNAFIVAFLDGNKITMSEALRLIN